MRILIADDDPISRHLLARTLSRWGYEVVSCCNGKEAMQHIQEEGIKLAILDWVMPELDGIEVCRQLRSFQDITTYLVLLSAKNTQMDVIAGLEAGADDFIRKPFDAAELRARLKAGMRIVNLQQSLNEQAIRDPLTGLYNRRYMQETLDRELIRAERKRVPVSVILADIDHFKRLNDTYGHQAGDTVLRFVARFLQDHIRSGDVACRFGGEEFLLILPEASAEISLARAESVREGISECEIEYQGRRVGAIQLSAGVAVFPLHGASSDELIQKADTALYEAKVQGRNRVVLHPLLHNPAPARAEWRSVAGEMSS